MSTIEECTTDGININVTLVFSTEMYEHAAEAYIRGLQRRLDAEEPIAHIASANSLFLSRIDTAVDAILDTRIAEDQSAGHLRGKTATAIAKLAYQRYRRSFEASSFHAIRQRGGRAQRLLWASTGTKDATYSDLKYVEPLVAGNSINTMPSETLTAFLAHGNVRRDAILDDADAAHETLQALAEHEIDLTALLFDLQKSGIEKFCASFDELLDAIDRKIKNLLADPVTFS